MPEVVAERAVARPLPEIWGFVTDFDQWAPLLPGYVSHSRTSPTESTWTLEGDVGPFSRTVTLAVRITDERAPERLAFDLVGVGEDARGGGTFELAGGAPPALPIPWWRAWLDWLLRRPPPPPPGPATTHVRFTFRVEAGGPMGPMINALLGPFADEVARSLVDRVAARLEAPP